MVIYIILIDEKKCKVNQLYNESQVRKMPGCAKKECKNSFRQGVKMNRLPRDSIKRKKWITNCEKLGGMKNWSPLDTAALCEVCFLSTLINIYSHL